METRRVSIIIIFVLLAIFSLTIFPNQAKAAYKVGGILSTSGKYGAIGQEEKNAMLLLLDKINKSGGIKNHPLELIIEDDEGDIAKAGSLTRKLITENKVVAIIGTSNVAGSHIVAQECEKRMIPNLYLIPQISILEGKKWVFMTNPTSENQIKVTIVAIKKLKKSKVGVLHDSNEYGTELRDIIVKAAKERGDIAVVGVESYQKGDVDLKPQLIKLKNKGADLLYIAGSLPTPAIAIKNLREMNIDIPIICAAGVVSQAFLKLGGPALEGVYAVSPLHYGDLPPRQKEFFEAIKKKFDIEPTAMHAYGWGALELMVNAMKVGGDDPRRIRDALEKTNGFAGVLGEYNMSPTCHYGLGEGSYVTVRIQNGTWRKVNW